VLTAVSVLLSVSTLVKSSPMLGAAQCSWGPSYWCANIPQASKCGAMKHCIKAVWEKETVPQDDDEVCRICKEMVGEARDTLVSNETQEELREVFDGSCDLIPIKLIAKECKALSDQFIPELVETLASEMNPDTVCTVSGLCNSARIDKMLEDSHKQAQFGGDCNVCREGAREVKRRLRTASQEEVEDKMLELCGYLGSFSTACMETVLDQSTEIYKMLTEQFDEEICDLSGLCSQSFERIPATTLQEGEDIQCEFCEKVIQHWIDVYASNSSLQEFKAILDGICEKVDKNNADHCKHIVDDYYIPAFEFIRTQLKPHMLCSVVGLCSPDLPQSLNTSKAPPAISMVKLSPAQRQMAPGALNERLYVPASVVQANSPSCVMCEYVINSLDNYIEDRSNEAEIKKAVESICDKMPGSVKAMCDKFVETYEPAIVAFIVNNIDSDKMCSMLHLCDAEENYSNSNLLQSNSEISLKSDSSCEMCEFVMSEVFSVLKDPSDQEMVKNVLESICYRLPSSIERGCEDFVEKYTSVVIDFIVSGLSPDEVCSALQLCSSSMTAVVTPAPVKDTSCVLCEYVITTVDSMLEDKANQDQIKAALETVCSVLPSSVEKQCDDFVDQYTAIIIDMLTKDVSPEMVCANLGLCKQVSNVVIHEVKIIQEETRPYCSLCEMVVVDLDSMLQDKKNEAEIEQALSVVCSSLSAPIHKQCEKLVAKYTEKIIDMFVKDYSPKMICTELSMCVNNEINTNSIEEIVAPEVSVKENVGCAMCEFAMTIINQHLTDNTTIDQVERIVQFMCSYLPGTIADRCEEFVDEYGQKVIDAIVHDELKPTAVCSQLFPDCAKKAQVGSTKCVWGPSFWCSTPFHARVCGTTEICKKTVWKTLSVRLEN